MINRGKIPICSMLHCIPSSSCMYVCMYVTGTSQATILALSAARVKLFGTDVRKTGIRDLPEIRVYVSSDVHSCINKGD